MRIMRFARNADDIADSADLAPEEKVARLDVMEEVLLGKRLEGSPSAARLRRSLNETGVTPVHATDLLIAFRQDATKRRYETFDELYNYCRYSAVPVGRYVIDLHGESHAAYRASDALCISLQLLNHLQDCGTDMRTLDRCYIPQTLMRHFRRRYTRSAWPGGNAGAAARVHHGPGPGGPAEPRRRGTALSGAEPAAAGGNDVHLPAVDAFGGPARQRRPAGATRQADEGRRDPQPAARAGSARVAVGTPLGASQADLDEVERLVRNAGTSFYRGMRVLPPDRRHAMYAIYAFCRIVDDIADEDGALPEKLRGLAAWRAHVAGLYRGESEGPVTRVLVAAVERFRLREEDFAAVIDGMRMDAETVIVAPDLATLDLYCDRVAAAVGRLSVRAFGDGSGEADKVAYSLGRALQLTNILRDIKEDADRGRLYLPAEYLDEAGVPRDPAAALASPRLPVVCARLAADARRHFNEARAHMATVRSGGDEAGAADG